MNISGVFNVFSRRDHSSEEHCTSLTPEFRNRVLLLCRSTFSGSYANDLLWEDLYPKLQYLLGSERLSGANVFAWEEDLYMFLDGCSDEHFLDFLELFFKSESIWKAIDPKTRYRVDIDAIIENVNTFFEVDNLPYRLTKFNFNANGMTNPQIIRSDSEVLHQTAVEPVLRLLMNPAFSEANEEFLMALKDYRMGDFGDCLTKCGSSFESVMKVICDSKGWSSQKGTANILNDIISKTSLPPFLKHPLIQIATIRNALSSSHGAGTKPRNVPKHLAQYSINVTASAILLLVEEVKL